MPSLALYQPDRPHNLGAMIRLCACFSVRLDIIEPCGFPLSDKRIRQSAMDYVRHVEMDRHLSFDAFARTVAEPPRRLVLLSTKGTIPYHHFVFDASDVLLLGSEGAGVPDVVHERADAVLAIPMAAGLRSLNVATAGAIVVSEALRQTGALENLG